MPFYDFTGQGNLARAVYVCAVQLGHFDRIIARLPRALPWLSKSTDLDFLDPSNPFFLVDRFLISPGSFLHRAVPPLGPFCKRPGVTVLADSGGFQFIGDAKKWRADKTREWVLRFHENYCDEAITLDIPTAAIRPHSPWPDFAAALQDTRDNLDYCARNRPSGSKVRYLNALQGRTAQEANEWFDAVKDFPGGGWAFGGAMRGDFQYLVVRLRQMAKLNLLGPSQNRVHILGKSDLTTAVALSAIQRGMRKFLNDSHFLISFDTSTPFFMVKNGRAFGAPELRPGKNPTMSVFQPPFQYDPKRLNTRWPISISGVGRSMTLGDLNVLKGHGNTAQSAFDSLSYALMIHHNLNMLLIGIDMANAASEMAWADAQRLLSAEVHTSCVALEKAASKGYCKRILEEPKHATALISIQAQSENNELNTERE
ncbi:hypothetical protein [Sphingomonas sp. RB1R13]|uniref:hypothetical protein n=1 Tax=Sphingomonas sp. RB1R13 TaxID=3096159 RepID=UPI002FC97C82